MLFYDTTAIAGDDKELIAVANTANTEAVKLKAAYDTMLEADRAYNRQLATTKTAFAAVADKIAFVTGAAQALGSQEITFPEPAVEPEPWPESALPKSRAKR